MRVLTLCLKTSAVVLLLAAVPAWCSEGGANPSEANLLDSQVIRNRTKRPGSRRPPTNAHAHLERPMAAPESLSASVNMAPSSSLSTATDDLTQSAPPSVLARLLSPTNQGDADQTDKDEDDSSDGDGEDKTENLVRSRNFGQSYLGGANRGDLRKRRKTLVRTRSNPSLTVNPSATSDSQATSATSSSPLSSSHPSSSEPNAAGSESVVPSSASVSNARPLPRRPRDANSAHTVPTSTANVDGDHLVVSAEPAERLLYASSPHSSTANMLTSTDKINGASARQVTAIDVGESDFKAGPLIPIDGHHERHRGGEEGENPFNTLEDLDNFLAQVDEQAIDASKSPDAADQHSRNDAADRNNETSEANGDIVKTPTNDQKDHAKDGTNDKRLKGVKATKDGVEEGTEADSQSEATTTIKVTNTPTSQLQQTLKTSDKSELPITSEKPSDPKISPPRTDNSKRTESLYGQPRFIVSVVLGSVALVAGATFTVLLVRSRLALRRQAALPTLAA